MIDNLIHFWFFFFVKISSIILSIHLNKKVWIRYKYRLTNTWHKIVKDYYQEFESNVSLRYPEPI